jgi:uncharacterized protein YdeI (YjbR/CyaY-like superfamily)
LEKELFFSNRKEWRTWLEINHDKQREIWLIFYKIHIKKPCISYNDSVEEALCFGWIDSIKKRIDDEKYTFKFTPRRKTSKWSPSNIKRVEKMIKEGKMKEIGLNHYKLRGHYNEKEEKLRKLKKIELPKDLESKIRLNSVAWKNFNELAPSYKKQYILWLTTAKREETKERRLKEAITLLEKKQKLGMK